MGTKQPKRNNIWKWIDWGERIHFVWLVGAWIFTHPFVLAGGGAVIAVIWAFFDKIPAVYIALAGLFAFGVILWIVNSIGAWLERRKRITPPKGKDSDDTKWLLDLADKDRQGIKNYLHIHSIRWEWNINDNDKNPNIGATFEVVSASVYSISVKGIQGSMTIDKETPNDRPATISSAAFYRGQIDRFRIQQSLSERTTQQLSEAMESKAEIAFAFCNICLHIEGQILDEGISTPSGIVHSVKTAFPLQDWYINWELKVIPGTGQTFYP